VYLRLDVEDHREVLLLLHKALLGNILPRITSKALRLVSGVAVVLDLCRVLDSATCHTHILLLLGGSLAKASRLAVLELLVHGRTSSSLPVALKEVLLNPAKSPSPITRVLRTLRLLNQSLRLRELASKDLRRRPPSNRSLLLKLSRRLHRTPEQTAPLQRASETTDRSLRSLFLALLESHSNCPAPVKSLTRLL